MGNNWWRNMSIQEWKPTPRCLIPSPVTGKLCTMAQGHTGPHKVGGPDKTTERFVIKCTGKCIIHENSDGTENYWNECIFCGDKTPHDLTKTEIIGEI